MSADAVRRRRLALGAALALVLAVRLVPLFGVFRGGDVVLLSNDPYYYRYLVERAVAGGGIPSLSGAALGGEPLLVATLAVPTALLGGGPFASGVVLAWYPVLAALLTGVAVYLTAVRLTDDVRVGLAAVGVLAVTPAHAYRTALGVADHHAFDFLWLSLTMLAAVELLTRAERDRRTWYAAGLLGVAVAGQTLAWEAAPLLQVPLAAALALAAVVEVRRGDASRLVPVAAGLGGGAVLAHGAHVLLGWQVAPTVYALDALFLGGVGLTALAMAVVRVDRSWPTLAALELVGLGILVFAWHFVPVLPDQLTVGLSFLEQQSGIGELSSLGSVWGIYGPLLILGFAPLLAAPVLVWALHRGWRRAEPAWFVVCLYALHFGALATLQRRFAGELAPFAAVLGGVGFVALVAWFDLVHYPAPMRAATTTDGGDELVLPDRRRLLLLSGFSVVMGGAGALYTALIDQQLIIDPDSYRAARWMRRYADERGWAYPENYVLSKWGRNRMYNYFVNGESESYRYAERFYESFLFSGDEVPWYRRFSGRVGFVVTRDLPHLGYIHPSRMQSRLHERLGSQGEGYSGSGHFRAVYASPDGSRKVFTLVPGATIEGAVPAGEGESPTVATDVSIPGADFRYVRRSQRSEDGDRFSITVAHPGEYRVGATAVTVPESAVVDGETVSVPS